VKQFALVDDATVLVNNRVVSRTRHACVLRGDDMRCCRCAIVLSLCAGRTTIVWYGTHSQSMCDRSRVRKIVGSYKDGAVRVWSVLTGALLHKMRAHTDEVRCV
jgi:hypothetical protein